MRSKERLLLAINHKEPDHIPLMFKWSQRGFLKETRWVSEFERAKAELKMGLDPYLQLGYDPAWKLNSGVRVKLWREPPTAGEEYPLLIKEYHTSKGVLKQIVRQTHDWPYGDYIPLRDDFILPHNRSKKFLIGDMNDLEAYDALFYDPTEIEQEQYLKEAESFKKFAEEHGILVFNSTGSLNLTDAAIYALGMENMFSLVFKNPELITKFLDILLVWNLKYLRLILEAKTIDIVNYQGWCESYFPIKQYKTIIAPRVKKIVEMAHKFGVKVCYTPRDPPLSLYEMFKDIGIDIFWGCDPRSSAKYFPSIKKTIGDKICIWGGVNSQVTLGIGSKKQIEEETINAIKTLGAGSGLILSAFDYLDGYTPWKSIEHMIRVWRKNMSHTNR